MTENVRRLKMWKCFGVKTVYRTQATGRPRSKDNRFDPTIDLVEERIVLFRTRSHQEAIRKAEAEARKYATFTRWRNPYGQQLRQRYLGACDSYELFDNPGAAVEVYSKTYLVAQSVSDHQILAQFLGPAEPKELTARRINFLDEMFNRIP
jgi:hypothetical protein